MGVGQSQVFPIYACALGAALLICVAVTKNNFVHGILVLGGCTLLYLGVAALAFPESHVALPEGYCGACGGYKLRGRDAYKERQERLEREARRKREARRIS